MNNTSPDESPEVFARTRAGADLCGTLNLLLGHLIGLYVKTKHLTWHAPGLRDAHLLLQQQGTKLLAAINAVVHRVHQFGGEASPSIAESIGLLRSRKKSGRPLQMLGELYRENLCLALRLRAAFDWFHERGDGGTARMIEKWIDEAERRMMVLFEALLKRPG